MVRSKAKLDEKFGKTSFYVIAHEFKERASMLSNTDCNKLEQKIKNSSSSKKDIRMFLACVNNLLNIYSEVMESRRLGTVATMEQVNAKLKQSVLNRNWNKVDVYQSKKADVVNGLESCGVLAVYTTTGSVSYDITLHLGNDVLNNEFHALIGISLDDNQSGQVMARLCGTAEMIPIPNLKTIKVDTYLNKARSILSGTLVKRMNQQEDFADEFDAILGRTNRQEDNTSLSLVKPEFPNPMRTGRMSANNIGNNVLPPIRPATDTLVEDVKSRLLSEEVAQLVRPTVDTQVETVKPDYGQVKPRLISEVVQQSDSNKAASKIVRRVMSKRITRIEEHETVSFIDTSTGSVVEEQTNIRNNIVTETSTSEDNRNNNSNLVESNTKVERYSHIEEVDIMEDLISVYSSYEEPDTDIDLENDTFGTGKSYTVNSLGITQRDYKLEDIFEKLFLFNDIEGIQEFLDGPALRIIEGFGNLNCPNAVIVQGLKVIDCLVQSFYTVKSIVAEDSKTKLKDYLNGLKTCRNNSMKFGEIRERFESTYYQIDCIPTIDKITVDMAVCLKVEIIDNKVMSLLGIHVSTEGQDYSEILLLHDDTE